MKSDKQQKAHNLFESIGEIDDTILQDALTYMPQKRRQLQWRLLPLAACLILCTALLLATFPILYRPQPTPPSNDGLQSNGAPSLDTLLLELRDRDVGQSVTNEQAVPFFDGYAYLVWQYRDSGELCISQALSGQELASLSAEFGKGERIDSDAASQACRLWLVLGNGEVYSPYLPLSSGNVGQADLFDYEAELQPSDGLIAAVTGILEAHTR